MSEKPILFSAPMVRAILAGTKTQTRRIVKRLEVRHSMPEPEYQSLVKCCPYGVPGDRLWVRETWAHDGRDIETVRSRHEDALDGGITYGPYYRADSIHEDTGLTWRPAIHMPRWASRITLEITDVRVQRLQDISEDDAKAEGAPCIDYGEAYNVPHVLMRGAGFPGRGHAYGFQRVWGDINGAESWLANPWVWALTFKPAHPQEGR